MSELALKLIREAKEKRLTRIDLGNCGLTELPDELFELTWLEELILCSMWLEYDLEKKVPSFLDSKNKFNKKEKNTISYLNNDIKKLQKLKKLILSNDYQQNSMLNDLKPLESLLNLEELYISYTSIDDLTVLKNLTKLQSLDLSKTEVKDLNPLKDLINLEYLNLTYCQVADLSPLENLTNLKLVGLSSTKVSDIKPLTSIIANGISVSLMNRLGTENSGIYLNNCPLTTPPKEIIERGKEAILSYWKQVEIWEKAKSSNTKYSYEKFLENYPKSIQSEQIDIVNALLNRVRGTVELYEAKLIIVGEGATGKTTLFEKLKDNNHPIGNTQETHGINIHEGLPFTHTHIGDNTFYANLWDFGGQELQYMTHQFFLTPRALYVLMMDARRESPNLAYWFKIISLLGRDREDSIEKVRLLLVFNKRGNSTGTPPQYQDQLKYYADSLDVQYLEVDFSENDYRFDNLQKAIQQSLVTLPIVKSQLPRLWKVVREDLREEAKTECYIDTKRFSAICSKHGITEEADQWLLSGYLHQLGSLLHFQNDKGLRRLVILSPQWAVDGVYTFLSEESIARNNGRFTETEFLALLATKGYNHDAADVILQLMTKNNFDICYEATEGHYVAAQLLPDNRPENFFWEKRFGALQFRYQYPIMPKGLMSRLIVRLSEYIEKRNNEEVVWKKGAILSIPTDKNNLESYSRVLMYEDDAESKSGIRQIIFEVMGIPQTHRKHALQRIREEVESLHKKWFRSIKADEMVPCCCSECTISETPQLYKLENLLKLKEKRQITICYSSGDDVMIQQLLEGVYDRNEIRDMENQGKY